MANVSVGDLAQSFMMRGHNSSLKTQLSDLSATLASGRHEDMAKALRGDFSELASVENGLRALAAHRTTAEETATLLSAAQATLGMVQDVSSSFAPALVSAGNSGHPALIRTTAADAAQKFDGLVSALNVRVGDRSLFAGVATDQSPMAPGNEILAALTTAVAGTTTAKDLIEQVDIWFNALGGGFESLAYRGSTRTLPPFPVADGERVTFETTALSPQLRPTLQAFALAALAYTLPASGNSSQGAQAMKAAGELMLTAQTELSVLRADVGVREEQTDAALTRTNSSISMLKIAQSNLYSADPYETVTQLEIVQTQLEAVYTLTARLSRLSLAEYLK